MAYLSHQSGRAGNHYEFTGDLSLVQKEPLWKRYSDSRYNYDVIPRKSSNSEDYTLSKIFVKYAHRNGKVKYFSLVVFDYSNVIQLQSLLQCLLYSITNMRLGRMRQTM